MEWYQQSAKGGFVGGFLLSVAILAFLILRDWGIGWMTTWWLWLFVVWPPFVFYFVDRRKEGFSAGAEWFSSHRGNHVRLYELTEVLLNGNFGGWTLELRDKHDGRAAISLYMVQTDRDLWDLVFNGIVYSVRHGAKTNSRADGMFFLA